MITYFEEGKHLERVRTLFIYPLVVIVEKIRIPVCPCCRQTVGIDKVEIVVDNMVENLFDRGRNELLFFIIGNKVKIVCIAIEMTYDLIGRGLAEPFALSALGVLCNVPFMAGACTVVNGVGISDSTGEEAFNSCNLGQLYH